MTTRTQIESQINQVKKRVNAEKAKRTKQVIALRAKAAEAALHWVMSHEDRVNAFRSSVNGTPVAKVLDALLAALRGAAGSKAKPKSKAKSAAKKKAPAKKAKPAARKR